MDEHAQLHNAAVLVRSMPPEIAALKSRFEAVQTRGAYIASVMEKIGIAREQRRLAARRKL